MSFKNLFHDRVEVGKTIKSSKIYYYWEMKVNDKYHKIELFHSLLSGKKKLLLDAQVLTEDKTFSNNFTYSFKLDKHYCNVIQSAKDNFELRIDNKKFNIILKESRYSKKNK